MMITHNIDISKELDRVISKDIIDVVETYIKDNVGEQVKEITSNNGSSSKTKELDEHIAKICYRVMSEVLGEVFKRENEKSFARMTWYGRYDK